jgi:hypothetical protein
VFRRARHRLLGRTVPRRTPRGSDEWEYIDLSGHRVALYQPTDPERLTFGGAILEDGSATPEFHLPQDHAGYLVILWSPARTWADGCKTPEGYRDPHILLGLTEPDSVRTFVVARIERLRTMDMDILGTAPSAGHTDVRHLPLAGGTMSGG